MTEPEPASVARGEPSQFVLPATVGQQAPAPLSGGVVMGFEAPEPVVGRGWAPMEGGGEGYIEARREGEIVVLVPGTGFSGPTPQPERVGAPGLPGATAKPMARWDAVPFQTFDENAVIGIVAFHVNGIDRVDFSLNAGPWIPVTDMTLNPRTGVWEYAAVVPVSELDDGPIEVRAVVWPAVAGTPRLLGGEITDETSANGEHSMFVYANGDGTLSRPVVYVSGSGSDSSGQGTAASPYRNLWRASEALQATHGGDAAGDGAVIRCLPGTYLWRRNGGSTAQTRDAWITIEPAAGVSRASVVITKANDNYVGIDTKLVRMHNLTIRGEPLSLQCNSSATRFLWIDGCHLDDGGRFWTNGWYEAIYVTDSLCTNMTEHALVGCNLVRNTEVNGFDGDAYKACRLVVNCVVADQRPESNLHSDIWQYSEGYTDNIILFGIEASEGMREQGFFSRTWEHNDVAIVNCNLDMRGYPAQSQWKTRSNHMLVLHNTFLGSPFQIALSDSLASVSGYYGSEDCLWSRNVFQWLSVSDTENTTGPGNPEYGDIFPGTVFVRNHFVNLWPAYTGNSGQPHNAVVFGSETTVGPNIPASLGAFGDAAPPWLEGE